MVTISSTLSFEETNFDAGRIPIIIDNTQSPPFPVIEISAELLYLLKFDTNNQFGFEDELEKSEVLQWLFF
jgi:glutathione S-transferase